MVRQYLYAGVVVAVVLGMAASYVKGRADESASRVSETRKELVEQLNERNATDGEVSRMSPADICVYLGGVYRDGQCE